MKFLCRKFFSVVEIEIPIQMYRGIFVCSLVVFADVLIKSDIIIGYNFEKITKNTYHAYVYLFVKLVK